MKSLILRYPFLFWLVLLVFFFATGYVYADEKIVYRLKWLRNMSTAGDLYADAQGFFNAQGLSVTIKPGGPERDAIRELELGYADFGVASADQVIRALTKGSPVVVIAQLFQVNPLHWIYRRDRVAFEQLTDLRSKTLGVTFGKNDEIIMLTLLARAKIPLNQVRLYSVRLDYTPFYKGAVDLWPVYINTQGVEIGRKMELAGEAVGFFNPGDFGVRFVANSVVTTERTLERRPETVRRFIHALLKGWRHAMDQANADRAIAIVQNYDRDTSVQVLQDQLVATRPLIRAAPGRAIGSIDRQAWQQTEEIMLSHKQIDRPVHVLQRLHPIAEGD